MKILLRHGNKEDWKMVTSAAYKNEKELQKLLADSPSLISIDDVRLGAGTLVTAVREIPLPIGFLDLIAFSAQGDVAIIECKLADNMDIKRKVIGQAMEYGAHMWGMSYAELDEKVKIRTERNLADLVSAGVGGSDWDEETFRSNVENALQTGKFILMIVVDEINDDLARIIQFMNACGSPSFTFAALEMRRFSSGDAEMLVPRIVGDTRSAPQIAVSGQRKRWTPDTLLEEVKNNIPKVFDIFSELYEWSRKHSVETRLGTGIQNGSFTFVTAREDVKASIFSVYTNGTLSINFAYLEKIYTDEEIAQFHQTLTNIPGFQNLKKDFFSNIPLVDAFSRDDDLSDFEKAVLDFSKLE